MEKTKCRLDLIFCFILLVIFLTSHLPLDSIPLLMETTADRREYEVDKFDENITISPNNIRAITFYSEEGEDVEIIYTLAVKEGLPIDVWFVNEDNYILFVNGAQFLYIIDGTEQQLSYTKKIVSLEKPGVYKLVLANYYNNQTIEVNIICELRTFTSDSGESSSVVLSIFFFLPLLAIGILVALIMILYFKVRKHKQTMFKYAHLPSSRQKAQKHKPEISKTDVAYIDATKNVKIRKVKKTKTKVTHGESPTNLSLLIPKEAEPQTSEKIIPGFCGYCGKPVTTSYCIYCGNKIYNS